MMYRNIPDWLLVPLFLILPLILWTMAVLISLRCRLMDFVTHSVFFLLYMAVLGEAQKSNHFKEKGIDIQILTGNAVFRKNNAVFIAAKYRRLHYVINTNLLPKTYFPLVQFWSFWMIKVLLYVHSIKKTYSGVHIQGFLDGWLAKYNILIKTYVMAIKLPIKNRMTDTYKY